MRVEREEENDREVRESYWLTPSLIDHALLQRHHHDEWQVRIKHWLHSDLVQWTLIALLLCDTLFVVFELLIESEYPGCDSVVKWCVSCCSAENSASAVSAVLSSDRLLGEHPHHNQLCEAPYEPTFETSAGCDPHAHAWTHTMHSVLTLLSVLILTTFELELIGMISCLKGLFFRSRLYILDLFIVTFSLGILLYIYDVQWQSAHDENLHSPEHLKRLDRLKNLLLLSRLWRMVRLAHGIATALQEVVSKTKEDVAWRVDELRDKLATCENSVERKTGIEIDDDLKPVYGTLAELDRLLH